MQGFVMASFVHTHTWPVTVDTTVLQTLADGSSEDVTPSTAGHVSNSTTPQVHSFLKSPAFAKSQSVYSPEAGRSPEPDFLRSTSEIGIKSHLSEHVPRSPAKRGKVTSFLNTLSRPYVLPQHTVTSVRPSLRRCHALL
ncbi:hypothetical protein T484DRAFT_2383710 [Baffinella frigidus]|nr:hypothetical protein T484DRAFT_2383710 [Cryptophyta sp. CCMP2293]